MRARITTSSVHCTSAGQIACSLLFIRYVVIEEKRKACKGGYKSSSSPCKLSLWWEVTKIKE